MRSYEARIEAEKSFFTGCDVHALPPIFHYWSDKYVRPKLEAAGYAGPHDVFRDTLRATCERHAGPLRFLSIGAGDCALEVSIAAHLRERGFTDFVIDCLDLNESMLDAGAAAAERAGVAANIAPHPADFNHWQPEHGYDAVIAVHVLHHVTNLEGLYAGIKASLRPEGRFVVADMVGRNGHERWPESLAIVHEFWRKLPPSYRLNRQLNRYEEMFQNYDCSQSGFEGIRAQDVLPLLTENFAFEWALAYGNVIEPFVDRSFGPNFDADAAWDRAFIDAVHARDEFEIARGTLKPTHLIAILTKDGPSRFDTSALIRRPTSTPDPVPPADAYDWFAWPNSPLRELQIVVEKLAEFEQKRTELKEWSIIQTAETAHLKEIVRREQAESAKVTGWAVDLDRLVGERTAWAQRLDRELAEQTARVVQLEKDLAEMTRLNNRRWWQRLRDKFRA